jgi:hypothetical protein
MTAASVGPENPMRPTLACRGVVVTVLYPPEKKVVYGTVFEKGKTTVIGNPPPAVAGELGKLWQQEWRTPAK